MGLIRLLANMDNSNMPLLLRDRLARTLKECAMGTAISLVIIIFMAWWFRSFLFFTTAIAFLSTVIGYVISSCKPRVRVIPSRKAVLITGCDTGFGYMLAQELDSLGFQVFAGCLQPDGNGAKELKSSTTSRLHVLGLDVTKQDQVENSVSYINKHLKENTLWAVVCNAGINDRGEINWTSLEVFKHIMDVNAFGVIRVTKAFLPQLCKSKGRVVIVTSMAGRSTIPRHVPYSITKYAARSFTDSLRYDMYDFGVEVVMVEPSPAKTYITEDDTVRRCFMKNWESAPMDVKALYEDCYAEKSLKKLLNTYNFNGKSHPQKMVKSMVDAVTHAYPRHYYSPGVLTKFSTVVLEILPKAIADKLILETCLIDYN